MEEGLKILWEPDGSALEKASEFGEGIAKQW
jgi:hypothetical protein